MDKPTLDKELALLRQGFSFVAGLDEAGRGAWAGPVVAAAVILPLDHPNLAQELEGVRDSKTMTPTQRLQFFETIRATALAVGVGVSSHRCIDQRRIIFATRRAMQFAVSHLSIPPDYLLIDALPLPDLSTPQDAFPKADALSLTVAAASIVAKVSRDQLMIRLDERYQNYGFARHKGYGTAAHQAALDRFGPCPIHRLSFGPLRVYQPGPTLNT